MTAQVRQPSLVRELLFILAAWAGTFVFMALIALVVAVGAWLILGAANVLPDPDQRWPRLSAWAVVAIPLVALALAFVLSRRSHRTFHDQQRANRRISLLLLVTMVGLVTALGEAIAASLTFNAQAALAGAALAALIGGAAAAYAHFRGANAVLDSARARPAADAPGERVLNDVVTELSIAANMPRPRVFVIGDESTNAMAVGTTPDNAAIAVTSGLLRRFDREQLQGVIAHELGHIRNLDTRYGVYVAMLVGLVALVTDGFLRMVIRAWGEGVFFRGAEADDAKGAIAGLAAGVLFGIFLLTVALLLRVFAPIASLLVQAAVSRERELLADATSVELTRNPTALARALDALRDERDPLDYANRGSQHLWFASPFGSEYAVRWKLFATHPSLDDRIERLAELYPVISDESSRPPEVLPATR